MPHPTLPKLKLLLLSLGAAALLAPAAASAAEVTTPGSPAGLHVQAAAGDEDFIDISCQFAFNGPSTCVVKDFAGLTESSELCVSNSSTQVTCTGNPMTADPTVDLGDLDDVVRITSDNVQRFNVTGGTGDDTIYGGDGGLGDNISAGPGDDWVEGRFGGDTIRGNGGRDTIVGNSGFNLIYGDEGSDTLISGPYLGTASALYGGLGNDHLIGGRAGDFLYGGFGNDLLDGGRGNDDLDGGADFDTVDYQDRSAGVTVDLDSAFDDGNAEDASGDNRDRVRTSVERVVGGVGVDRMTAAPGFPVTFEGNSGNDILIGSDGADTLLGVAGADTLDGRGGADTLNGGSSVDTVDYRSRSGRVAVRLDDLRNDGADGDGDGVSSAAEEGDLVLGVENASTGSGDDYLRGNALVNRLSSGAGADRIRSRDGTTGVDVLTCGSEIDIFDRDGSDTISGCETAGTLP